MQPKLDDCIFHQAILTATVLIDKRTSSSDHLMLAKNILVSKQTAEFGSLEKIIHNKSAAQYN